MILAVETSIKQWWKLEPTFQLMSNRTSFYPSTTRLRCFRAQEKSPFTITRNVHGDAGSLPQMKANGGYDIVIFIDGQAHMDGALASYQFYKTARVLEITETGILDREMVQVAQYSTQ